MWTNVVSVEGYTDGSMLYEYQHECRYLTYRYMLIDLNILVMHFCTAYNSLIYLGKT